MGNSFGGYIFELFARETNLKRKRKAIYSIKMFFVGNQDQALI